MEIEKKLDDILFYVDHFKIVYYPTPRQTGYAGFGSLTGTSEDELRNFVELSEILHEEKYIDFEKLPGDMFIARIKVRGEIFAKSGGYVQKELDRQKEVLADKIQNDRIANLEKYNLYVTVFASIVAVIVCFLQCKQTDYAERQALAAEKQAADTAQVQAIRKTTLELHKLSCPSCPQSTVVVKNYITAPRQ